MSFFSDHDVYGQTIKYLVHAGHSVTRAQDVGLAQAKDPVILEYAADHDMILLTRDKDFGALVFQRHIKSGGVIFLRIDPRSQDQVHGQLTRALNELDEKTLFHSFVVVEATHYRVRQLPDFNARAV